MRSHRGRAIYEVTPLGPRLTGYSDSERMIPMRLIFFLALTLSAAAVAKRSEPAAIKSIVLGDSIVNFRVQRADCQVEKVCAMQVFINSKNMTTGRINWERELYQKGLDPKVEFDVQLVLPKFLRLQGKQIIATDEKGTTYKLDLDGKLLSPLKSVIYPLTK